MEEQFSLVPEEVKLKRITIEDGYDYGEVVFTPVFQSLLKENAKNLATMTEDDPRRLKVTQTLSYFDSLNESGWSCIEILHKVDEEGNMHPYEVRRFRRAKS